MSEQRLRIDRLQVRLHGGSAHRARELAGQLGRHLPAALEQALGDEPASGARRVADLQAAPVRVARGAPARDTAAAVGHAVADALRREDRG